MANLNALVDRIRAENAPILTGCDLLQRALDGWVNGPSDETVRLGQALAEQLDTPREAIEQLRDAAFGGPSW